MMSKPVLRVAAVLALAVTAAFAQDRDRPRTAEPTRMISPDVVISQVYGGGGNSGATYTHDFIELFNRGTSTVDLNGWSVQYASAAGTSWQVTGIGAGKTIAPGQYFLIQEAQGAGGSTPLPTPDVVGSPAIAMAAGAGKVALVNNQTALTGSCPSAVLVVDFVGFGATANCFEGSGPTPAPSNTTSVSRGDGGCTETDQNSSDFTAGAPNPRNTASPVSACGGLTGVGASNPPAVQAGANTLLMVAVTPATVPPPPSTGITVTADLTAIGLGAAETFFDDGSNGDVTPGDNTFSLQVTVALGTSAGSKSMPASLADAQARTGTANIPLTVQPSLQPIHTLQGDGDVSPFVGQLVLTSGIVTAIKATSSGSNGYFIQTPDGAVDADPMTSEGMFVFMGSAPVAGLAVGDEVEVSGTLVEFSPSSDSGVAPLTEISFPTASVLSSGNPLPTPVTLTSADFGPALPFNSLEKYEGMRVSVPSLTVISPVTGRNEVTASASLNGVFYGVLTGTNRPFREPGFPVHDPVILPPPATPCCTPSFDNNPERLRVDSDALAGTTPLDVSTGAVITGIVGPLDYAFRTYSVLPDPGLTLGITPGISAAVPVRARAADELTVGSINLERFYDDINDPGGDTVINAAAYDHRLTKASALIRNVMGMPDIVAVVEMEKLPVLNALAARISADALAASQPDPAYAAFLVEGNDPGGIDVGFLTTTTRVNVTSVVQEGLTTTFPNPDTGTNDILNDRPPLVLQALVTPPNGPDFPVTVIVNHLRSLNDLVHPTNDRVREKRRFQAEFLADLVQDLQDTDPEINLLVTGDFNAFEFNDGYADLMGTIAGTPTPADEVYSPSLDLVDPDLENLVLRVPASERYSYTFDGSAQVLDHMLASANVQPLVRDVQFGRASADFSDAFRDTTGPERVTDHDSVVAFVRFPTIASAGDDQTVEATGPLTEVTLSGSGSDPDDDPLSFEWRDSGNNVVGTQASIDLDLPVGIHIFTLTVSDGGDGIGTDTVEITVRDTTPPAVQVTAPNGGETVVSALGTTIEWTAFDLVGFGSFTVAFSTDGGANWTDIAGCTSLGAAVRECDWTPAAAAPAVLVRVTASDAAANTSFDVSDAPFQVVAPFIGSGGRFRAQIGTTRAIQWKHNLGTGATVNIDVQRTYGSGVWEPIAMGVASATDTEGTFQWLVTGPASTNAEIRISWTADPAVFGIRTDVLIVP